MELDQKLARDEKKIKDAIDELHDMQSQKYSEVPTAVFLYFFTG